MALLLSFPTYCQADIIRFIQVSPGIFRGGQPTEEADYAMLAKQGVRTILNLRHERPLLQHEQQIARDHGLNFAAVPMNALERPTDETIIRALKILTDRRLQPVFIHCQHGKDRTGLVVGLYRVLFEKWARKDAHREMRRIGFSPFLAGLEIYFWRNGLEPSDFEFMEELR